MSHGTPSEMGEAHLALRDDDVGEVQRADAEQHGDDDEADRDFVATPSAPPSGARRGTAYFELDAQPPMMMP